jgi:hypothetical protein
MITAINKGGNEWIVENDEDGLSQTVFLRETANTEQDAIDTAYPPPPTQAEIDSITVKEIAAKRAVSITRREFCIALATEGVLQPTDAIAAAKGEWPAVMDSFLSFLDPAQSVDAQIEWAATGSVDRLHPFVLSLGSWLSLTEVQIDELFGIGA